MKCTSCKSGELKPSYIEDMIRCHTCDNCGGNFLYLEEYLIWRQRDSRLPDDDAVDIAIEAEAADETNGAILCPITGSFMLKYRISKDTNHRLDLSPKINAIWLDKGEWELIKQQGLAFSLTKIFTDPWQYKIKEDTARETFEGKYKHEFGEGEYQKLKGFRTWLYEQDKKSYMLAYLMAVDPYTVRK